jgi:hypothetical protein
LADSVEKLLQRILLAIFNRSGIWVRIYDSFRVFSLNHYCAKAAPKYSRESFSTESGAKRTLGEAFCLESQRSGRGCSRQAGV